MPREEAQRPIPFIRLRIGRRGRVRPGTLRPRANQRAAPRSPALSPSRPGERSRGSVPGPRASAPFPGRQGTPQGPSRNESAPETRGRGGRGRGEGGGGWGGVEARTRRLRAPSGRGAGHGARCTVHGRCGAASPTLPRYRLRPAPRTQSQPRRRRRRLRDLRSKQGARGAPSRAQPRQARPGRWAARAPSVPRAGRSEAGKARTPYVAALRRLCEPRAGSRALAAGQGSELGPRPRAAGRGGAGTEAGSANGRQARRGGRRGPGAHFRRASERAGGRVRAFVRACGSSVAWRGRPQVRAPLRIARDLTGLPRGRCWFHFASELTALQTTMAARVLVIGSGGREHSLAWTLAQSHHVKEVLVAPGNAGTACSGKISNAAVSITDHAVLAQFCKDEKIEFVVVGPEAPLAAGVVEDLTCAGVRCFGPTAQAAQLESSKKFAKEFMDRHGIPTAQWKAFTKPEDACSFIMSANFPALVVKASGLAAGKGVIVAKNKEEACKAVQEIMQEKSFGAAGETVVVEEFLDGEEVSCLCFTDGKTVAPMPPAQDHKRLLDGDQGPNTGGMGAYCPTPQVPTDLLLKIKNTILQRTVDGMQQEGAPYTGILYAGIMLTKDGPKVLEFNCRFGDPECQVILPLLKSDLYEVIQSTLDGLLSTSLPVWLENHSAVTVVMASKGYPGAYAKGVEITGFPEAQALGLQVFHAGTALKDGKVVTSGGRVLTVTAVAENLVSALEEAKKGLAAIKFEGAVYRKDIGFRAVSFLQQPRGLTYKESGVDIAAGNMLVKKIQPLAKATSRPGCSVDLGGFAGLFDLKAAGFKDPLLASGTDGVGTKLKIAQLCNKHDTIGQDLVAMCVNDILAQGAEPLFFLDYFSCGKLDLSTTEAVVAGIAGACRQAGCALLGGETAEMPDMYPPGEYDLAGFAVGAMERDQKLPQLERITEGDVVIGVASSGLHSNGFSLVRKIVARSSLQYSSPAPDGCGDHTLGDLLLTPTRIYSHSLLPVIRSGRVKALAHITGGGLLENIPRVLPKKLGVDLDACTWRIPKVFSWLQQEGQLSEEEMARTFNCGVGAALVVSKDQTDQILHDIRQCQEEAWVIGSVVACPEDSPRVRVKNLIEAMQMNGTVVSNGFLRSHYPAQQKKSRVAVLISGTGSNLQALIDSTQDAKSSTHIVVVISNKAGVAGLDKAEKAGIPTRVINHKLYKNRVEFDNAVDQVLEEFSVDIVCLAGFMRILSGPFVRKWNGKMLNIHPSLLPSFKGSNAHEQVLEAGVTITGCTVHFVAEDVDAGQIILQEAVPVKRGDSVATLSERVKVAEHRVFPAALQLVASGAVRLGEDGRVHWTREQ